MTEELDRNRCIHGSAQKFLQGGNQWRNKRDTIPRTPKSSNNVASTFLNMLLKDLRFEHGGAKLVSCPQRYLTSLRLWGQR